jgi:hypothetical protein
MRRLTAILGPLAGVAPLAVAVATAFAYTSQVTASQTVSTRELTGPSGLTAQASGHDVLLAWSAGGGGSGYRVLAAPAGAGGSCTGVTYAIALTTAGTSATDAGRFTPQGAYECYQVQTTLGGWTSVSGNPVAALRLGFVASAVQLANGGTAGQLDAGDRIVITFNQAVASAGRPTAANTVCVDKGTATVAVASTGSGGSCSATGDLVGSLAATTVSRTARYAATYTWTTASSLTVTVGVQVFGGQAAAITGSPTLVPSGALVSATGGFAMCADNTGGGDCRPVATGAF